MVWVCSTTLWLCGLCWDTSVETPFLPPRNEITTAQITVVSLGFNQNIKDYVSRKDSNDRHYYCCCCCFDIVVIVEFPSSLTGEERRK